MIKKIIKALTPPAILKLFYHPKNNVSKSPWQGNYKSWAEALKNSGGYNDEVIVNKVKDAILKVKNGEAIYERDSVIFDQKQYSWPLLATLENIVLTDKRLCVLDFGGSLGSTYYQNTDFLDAVDNLQWCVIEQQNFVECGRKYIQNHRIKFYENIESCLREQHPNVIVLSSVLQYLDAPFNWIKKFTNLKIPHIIIDRTSLISDLNTRLTVQTVPHEIYEASYPCWFFNEADLLKAFTETYKLTASFDSFADPGMVASDDKLMYWKGFLFKQKT